MAKRGRPIGATSKLKNPENVVAHYTSHLMECWLAGVPIQIDPDCWLVQPTRRRHTVPQTIQRTLCKLAIAHVMRLHQQTQAAALEIDDSLRRSKAHAGAVLRRQGWTDEQIAAWFKKLQVASGRRVQREFRVPTVKAELVEFVKAVLALVERKTPRYTARRKASERIPRKNDAVQIWLSSQECLSLNFGSFNRASHSGPKSPCFPFELVLRV